MNQLLKQILVFLLTVMTVFNTAGIAAEAEETAGDKDVYVYTEEDYALLEGDVFAKIEEVREQAAAVCGGIGHLRKADYVAMIPAVIEAVESSETYVPGSLQANGYFLVWETTTGIPCCYSPRMEAELHRTDDDPTQAERDAAEAEAEAMLEAYDRMSGGLPGSAAIGLIQPYWESNDDYEDATFTEYSPYYKAMWQNLQSASGGPGIRFSMKNATVDNIASAMEQCGLVMFDSHGDTDYYGDDEDYTSRANCSYLCLTTSAGITSQDTARQEGPFGTYFHCLKGPDYAYVSGTCIANHMHQDAPHSLLYMCMCLGMATDGMYKGLREKGVEVCYGYSQSVTFYGERTYMQKLLAYVRDGDTFGLALAKTKQELGNWDPAYAGYSEAAALKNKAAFPITVSSEDPYPGHGNVDAVQDVYSTWALYCHHKITAAANNSSYGSVSLDGVVVKAVPKDGCYVKGYEILSGSAQVTRRGDDFLINAASDCTIQIGFAKKVPAVITYMADGSEIGRDECMTADVIVLPYYADEPDGWTFIGWSQEEIEKTTDRPEFFAPGALYEVSGNAVLYAVYTMTEDDRDDVYELVTEWPDSLEGRYVITSGKTAGMHVLKGIAAGMTYESAASSGAAAFADTGMTLSGTTLSNVTDPYIFDLGSHAGFYHMQSAATGSYVDVRSKTLQAVASLSDTTGRWLLDIESNETKIEYISLSAYYLVYQNGVFAAKTGSSGMQVWKQSRQGTDWYGTRISGPAEEKPSFYGTSIVLSGQIGMNFHAAIPDQYRSSARVVIRTKDFEKEIPASSAGRNGTLYRFSCGVNAVAMADTITAILRYEEEGSTREVSLVTSVENYLHAIVDQADAVPAYRKAEKLARALNNYGYYAQKSLAGGPDHIQMAKLYADLALPAGISGYDVTFTANDTVSQGSFSLSLDALTTLNFYLSPYEKASAADIVVTDKDGNAVMNTTAAKSGSWYVLSVPGISAHMLGDTYTVTVNGRKTIAASALSYVQSALADDTVSLTAKNTAKALYGYYLQAIAYAQ